MNEAEKIDKTQGNGVLPCVTCRCKEVVIKYWVAVTPDGREVDIRGIENDNLKDGMELTGILMEDTVQHQYEDGSYARSYSIDEWLQVSNGR